MQSREDTLREWLENKTGRKDLRCTPLTGDASFRRYYRVYGGETSWIAMDSPPDREPLAPFVSIASLLQRGNVPVPAILHADMEAGFALTEDFGDTLLSHALQSGDPDMLYGKAVSVLLRIQACDPGEYRLPVFGEIPIRNELELFITWFVQGYLGMAPDASELAMLHESFAWITQAVSSQPMVVVHRDYHSRNLMIHKDELGVIDFQDACFGPWTYDAVSLFKDCYVQWPHHQVIAWAGKFHDSLPSSLRSSESGFVRDFTLCGLQRHLKVLGVFSRLYLRDNKPAYLADLPLTLHYILAALEEIPELQALRNWMQTRIQLP